MSTKEGSINRKLKVVMLLKKIHASNINAGLCRLFIVGVIDIAKKKLRQAHNVPGIERVRNFGDDGNFVV